MMNLLKLTSAVLLGMSALMFAQPVAAQDNDSPLENRGSLISQSDRDDRICGLRLFGGSCRDQIAKGGAKRLSRRAESQNRQQYNAFQRLAGAIADKMEAGQVGNFKFKFKIILE